MSTDIMNTENVTVKLEPPDDYFDAGGSAMSSAPVTQNGVTKNGIVSPASMSGTVKCGNRNFTCLLCDIICENRDELRRHLKTKHASKHHIAMATPGQSSRLSPETAITGFSSFIKYRYTCSICGAKLKTFRSYLNHNMSHRGANSLQSQFDDARMASVLSSGKQCLQDYIDSDDGYPGTFTCDECKQVFMQRDSYAMHMMMRAMNETCQPVVIHQTKCEPPDVIDDTSDNMGHECAIISSIDRAQQYEEPAHAPQRCLEDVTFKIDQDEYLKSVLDKVFVAEEESHDSYKSSVGPPSEGIKKCTFCGNVFVDQDSLAMHVMSDHAYQMTIGSRKAREARRVKPIGPYPWNLSAQSVSTSFSCKHCGEICLSRDSLAMHVLTHAHQDGRSSEPSGTANVYKRASESDITLLTSPRAKILRTIDRFNHISLSQKLLAEQTKQEVKSDGTDLFCGECNIAFYALSEYEWHQRRHLENKETADDEPLCLTKSSAAKTEEKAGDKERVQSTASEIKPRRNSFSLDGNLKIREPVPRRPLSADDCFSAVVNVRQKPALDECNVRMTDSASSTTSSECSTVLPNVNALSSNEQRIFYSVFGKDLSVAKELQNENKTKVSNDITVVSEPDKHVQTAPTDLTLSNTRSDSISASGYKNGDQDGRRPSFKLDKDTPMCKYCDILFLNKAIYYLHMGLHNVNNPWQCNVCGKICSDSVDFAAHVIHM